MLDRIFNFQTVSFKPSSRGHKQQQQQQRSRPKTEEDLLREKFNSFVGTAAEASDFNAKMQQKDMETQHQRNLKKRQREAELERAR